MSFRQEKHKIRARLGAKFMDDLMTHWLKHGDEAIDRLYRHDLPTYMRIMASSVRSIDINVAHSVDDEMKTVRTREELFDLVRSRGGQRAVEAFQLLLMEAEEDDTPSNVITLKPNPPVEE